MYDTKYSGKTPKKVGEQHAKKFAPDGAAPEYQRVGSKDRYPDRKLDSATSTHKSKHNYRKPWLNGGGNKQISVSYANRTHANFTTEKGKSTLISPTSRPPKAK